MIVRNKTKVARLIPVEKPYPRKVKRIIPKKAFGMWKDLRGDSVDIVNRVREEMLRMHP